MKKYLLILLIYIPVQLSSQDLFRKSEAVPRWSSFENPTGAKGSAAHENNGAKGHAFDRMPAGSSHVLMHATGPGIIDRIWITVSDRSTEMLRSLLLEMYWDDSNTPAVSVPLADFFCNGLAVLSPFENALFSNPERRSFNTSVPMPFKKSARIMITNKSKKDLTHIFYDVNWRQLPKWDDDMLYLHAYYNRETDTPAGTDYTILPNIGGTGRFLGVSMGVKVNKHYGNTWWGEGEIKLYLDGDTNLPTLAGTGVEDYVGTAWGLGAYSHKYQGCPIADKEKAQWSFYRFHIPDPIHFISNCKVTIQQIGGGAFQEVKKLYKNGASLIPVTVDQTSKKNFVKLLEGKPVEITDSDFPQGWVNFYRSDTISSVAYYYLNKP